MCWCVVKEQKLNLNIVNSTMLFYLWNKCLFQPVKRKYGWYMYLFLDDTQDMHWAFSHFVSYRLVVCPLDERSRGIHGTLDGESFLMAFLPYNRTGLLAINVQMVLTSNKSLSHPYERFGQKNIGSPWLSLLTVGLHNGLTLWKWLIELQSGGQPVQPRWNVASWPRSLEL